MKEQIKELVLGLGVDDIGFTSADIYQSPNSPDLRSIFPQVKSVMVMAYKELSGCESSNIQTAMTGRLDLLEFARSCNYKLGRFLERKYGAKAMTVSPSYPLEMSSRTRGVVGDVSLRHAAVAAGLGNWGRHNLVIHPEFGTRIIFSAVLCDLELPPDPMLTEELCTGCNKCIRECPAGALSAEGNTEVFKCLKTSQPYGLGSMIKFWSRMAEASPEEQQQMLKDEHYWRLYQAGFVGFQYYCFNCLKVCPVGQNA